MNIPILYEDDWFLIVDKPSGLLTIPSPRNESRTLISILNTEAQHQGHAYRLHPCHRLDRETSGVIVFAKGKSVQKNMMDLFFKREVAKHYTAFVQGVPDRLDGKISKSLEGAPALTRYRTLEKRSNYSVIDISPVTGRTNQIRVHFKMIGHPLVGEDKFAFRKDYALKAKRVCLHARSISFTHPVTRQAVTVEAPLAGDMRVFLERHR